MTTSQLSSKRRRKANLLAYLRQGRENRQYKKDKSGLAPRRGLPVDLRPERAKLNVLNRYIAIAQGEGPAPDGPPGL